MKFGLFKDETQFHSDGITNTRNLNLDCMTVHIV
jgi:hypothetical protein